MNVVKFTIDAIPPSVNSYVRHTRHGGHYKTEKTKAWETRMALAIRQGKLFCSGNSFGVGVFIYLGKGQKGDVDNFSKLILDPLARNGVFRSPSGEALTDARVTGIVIEKRRSEDGNPRTEITIVARD